MGQGSEVNLYFVSSNSVDVLAVSDKFLKLSKNSQKNGLMIISPKFNHFYNLYILKKRQLHLILK